MMDQNLSREINRTMIHFKIVLIKTSLKFLKYFSICLLIAFIAFVVYAETFGGGIQFKPSTTDFNDWWMYMLPALM